MKPKPILTLLLLFIAPLVCQGQEESEPKQETEKPVLGAAFVEEEVTKMIEGFLSDDEKVRMAAIDEVLPKESDFTYLFGDKKGKAAFKRIAPFLEKMKEANIEIKNEFETKGKLERVETVNIRESEPTDALPYQDVLKLIPEDVPVFRIVQHWEKGASGSSCYLIIERRLVFIRGLEMIPRFLKTLDAEKNKNKR